MWRSVSSTKSGECCGRSAMRSAQARAPVKATAITYHLSPITYHLSPITYHLSPITYHLSPITYHLSPITYHLSPITYHLAPHRICPAALLDARRGRPTTHAAIRRQSASSSQHSPSRRGRPGSPRCCAT